MTHHPHGRQPDRGPAPAFPNHDFSAAAILSRARAYAAVRAAEVAAAPPRPDPRSAAEILAAIEAEIAPAEPAGKSGTVPDSAALLAGMARAIDGGRP